MTTLPFQPLTHANADGAPSDRLVQLAQQIRQLETTGRPRRDAISSGCAAIDRVLPHAGHAHGSMIEVLRSASGTGTLTIALMIAKRALADGKYLVVVDPARQFYTPAMVAMGLPMERLIVLQPANHADLLWGLDQSLRCEAVGATIAPMATLDDRVARRLQLATEHGGGLGILLRDVRAAKRYPSWADVQWWIRSNSGPPRTTSPLHTPAIQSLDQACDYKQLVAPEYAMPEERRWFDLELVRCQGGQRGSKVRVAIDARGEWIDDVTSTRGQHEHASAVHLAAELAQPARRRREAAS